MAEHFNRGAWLGFIVAVVVWQLLVRPGVAATIDHESGISVPLLVLAGAFGSVGAGIGSLTWKALHDR
jgi:hypothetical protein